MMEILILSCALCLALGYCLAQELTASHYERKASEMKGFYLTLLRESEQERRELTRKLAGMVRAGWQVVPDEQHEVYRITPELEMEAEERDHPAHVTLITQER